MKAIGHCQPEMIHGVIFAMSAYHWSDFPLELNDHGPYKKSAPRTALYGHLNEIPTDNSLWLIRYKSALHSAAFFHLQTKTTSSSSVFTYFSDGWNATFQTITFYPHSIFRLKFLGFFHFPSPLAIQWFTKLVFKKMHFVLLLDEQKVAAQQSSLVKVSVIYWPHVLIRPKPGLHLI